MTTAARRDELAFVQEAPDQDSQGETLWTKQFGSSVDSGSSLAVDTNGNVYVVGTTRDGGFLSKLVQ